MIFCQVAIVVIVGVFGTRSIDAAPYSHGFVLNQKYSALIEGSMDVQADPCDDFYQYACGKWEEYHERTYNGRNQMLSMTDYEVNRELAQLLNTMSLRRQPMFVKKVHAFYKSCIRVQQFDHFSYLDWIKERENLKLPKLWTGRSSRSHNDWVHTLAIMRRYGLNGIFIEEIMIHRRDDNTKAIIDLDKPVEGRGFVPLSYENLQDLLQHLDMPANVKTFEKLWQDIQEFEQRLRELQDIEDEEGTRLVKVKNLRLPWLHRYLATILDYTILDTNMELYIQNLEYMDKLNELLKNYSNHFINRYLEVRFLWHLQQKGPRKFEPVECVDTLRNLMPLAMHWLYRQQHPEIPEYSEGIQEIFGNIVRNFKQSLSGNHLQFNSSLLTYLTQKLDNIQLKIGNLPQQNAKEILEYFYDDVILSPIDFYGNHLKLLNFNFKAVHSNHPNTLTTNISQFFNLEIYGEGSSSSPYFLTRANVIIVPFTTLRLPLYHPQYENIYKYSSLGSTLAHEIFHGFDRIGLYVDYRGKMNAWQYTTALATPKFAGNYNCLGELYPDVVDEKISDISGLRYAFRTFFENFPNASVEAKYLRGQEMSYKKIFFLNFAQLFCDPNISDAEHGEVSDRINDALAHFTEFSKAFQCSRQSRMLLQERCQVW
ncbi:neprilysin-1-like [Musca vetustissima]|uniref:neprilysin-1-like n=1 Tax=Musca vetustissima TaxID=27455 RepID=UPI002AB78E5D|nr:neprilysin-1-like [Musca vetustissima]